MAKSNFEEIECPICGTTHTCMMSPHCWCSSIDIPEELAEMLQLKYNKCLCKNCLTKLVDNFKLKQTS